MTRILNAEPAGYSAEARRVLQSVGCLDERPLDRPGLLAVLADYDVLIVRLRHQVDKEMLDAGVCLKIVATATTGLDHIDLEHARQRGVRVISLRGENEFLRDIAATAEMTWGLLLALVRRIPAATASVCAGGWDRDAYRGNDLKGKRLGILGLGRIGEKIARYGMAFEMPVSAFDPLRLDWPLGVERCGSLDQLLARSDVLSIHVPLNQATLGMIGRRELECLPAGACVVNTARGECLDEVALVDLLASGRLAGGALDVIRDERGGDEFGSRRVIAYARSNTNLLITPHIGGATAESMAATEVFIARRLTEVLAGGQARANDDST